MNNNTPSEKEMEYIIYRTETDSQIRLLWRDWRIMRYDTAVT